MDTIDRDQLQRLLAADLKAVGSKTAWSKRHGVSPQYLTDVLMRRRDPGAKLLATLGLERVITYRRVV